MSYYSFPCGCKFAINNSIQKEIDDGLPSLEIDYYNIPLNCKKTWEIYAKGLTQGTFQTESSLLKSWSRKLQPINIEELSDLISAVRPGTLKSFEDGKSMTQHFLDRKIGIEDYSPLHETIADILKPTYGIILYQEQAINIAKIVAAFTLTQADSLRKAAGKKDAQLMQKVRTEFIDGCSKAGLVSSEKANEIFDIIEKSNRYSFNLSHGIAYATVGYQTSYMKAHFPLQFYCSWLVGSREKSNFQEEISKLVNDAKSFGVTVLGPSICKKNKDFQIEDLKIRFGLSNIKGIGESAIDNLLEEIENVELRLGKKIQELTWFELLIHLFPNISKTVVSNLIGCGALSHIPLYRQQMLYEYNKTLLLTDKEIEKVKVVKIDNLEDSLRYLIGNTNKTRSIKIVSILESLINIPSSVRDTEEWIASVEEQKLGLAITCSKLDSCDTTASNISCQDFNAREYAENVVMSVTIDKVSEYVPKAGKMAGLRMLYITVSDKTGQSETVAFPKSAEEYDYLLFKGNTVLVIGNKSDKGSLTIHKVIQI